MGDKRHLKNDSVLPFSRRRQWHPTPVLLPGKFHGWRNLVGCSPWGRYQRSHGKVAFVSLKVIRKPFSENKKFEQGFEEWVRFKSAEMGARALPWWSSG